MQTIGHCVGYHCQICENTWTLDKFDLRMGEAKPITETCQYCEMEVCGQEQCQQIHEEACK